jgi:hypothetical protein
MLKVDVAHIRTWTVISKRSRRAGGGVVVEDGRKWYSDMCWAPQARLAVALAEYTYLGHEIKRL